MPETEPTAPAHTEDQYATFVRGLRLWEPDYFAAILIDAGWSAPLVESMRDRAETERAEAAADARAERQYLGQR